MPKLNNNVPSYRLHKPSVRAVVTLNGRDIYLGRYNSEESRENYHRAIKEWLTNHKHVLPQASENPQHQSQDVITVNEIFLPYWDYAQEYYQKYGKQTSESSSIKRALTPLLKLYGRQPAVNFGPLALKTYRQELINMGLTRGVVNNHVGRAKRLFRWAVENELIPPSAYQALQAVGGLRRGRSAAPESTPVKPVPDEYVDAVLPHVNRYVAAMIQLQRLTGMRPGEVTIIRGCDLDTTSRIWIYKPRFHKTEHHGRDRIVYLGPRAQEIIKPFLIDDVNAYLFSPGLMMQETRKLKRIKSKAPLSDKQRNRRRKRKPTKKPGEFYTVNSYEHAINKGCDKAFPMPDGYSKDEAKQWRKDHHWAPNRLRHSAATYLRKEFGIEAARVILGHSSAAITEIYAEKDHEKAINIMGQVG